MPSTAFSVVFRPKYLFKDPKNERMRQLTQIRASPQQVIPYLEPMNGHNAARNLFLCRRLFRVLVGVIIGIKRSPYGVLRFQLRDCEMCNWRCVVYAVSE